MTLMSAWRQPIRCALKQHTVCLVHCWCWPMKLLRGGWHCANAQRSTKRLVSDLPDAAVEAAIYTA